MSEKKTTKAKEGSNLDEGEVLLKLPAGLKYKLPGRRQRIFIGSLVIGLNLLLVIAVLLYFYNPAFHEFIFTIGRDWDFELVLV